MRRYFRWWGEMLTSANYHLSIERKKFLEVGFIKRKVCKKKKEGTNAFFSRYKGVIFRSWKQSLCSLFTHEIWRLAKLCRISTFFRYLFVKSLQIVLCFILGLVLFHKKEVWIVSKTLIMWLGTVAIRTFKDNYYSFKSKISKSSEF